MKNKKTYVATILAMPLFAAVLIFGSIPVFADEYDTQSPGVLGVIEGSGKHFTVTDSEYLNVSLESNEDIDLRLESVPNMIVIKIQASAIASSAEIKIDGMDPNTTYHKYEDNYHNYAPVSTDENGAFYFKQDISKDHLIFIQPRKSTKFIKDDATGGDCANIGIWDMESKTCTLNQDVNETVQLSNDGIILDGNGHRVTGAGTGNGIYVYGKKSVVKNVIVSGFTYGIRMANEGSVISNTFTGNYYGIYVYGSKENYPSVNIINNTVSYNKYYGICIYYAKNNVISENTVGPQNGVGLFQALSEVNNFVNNDFFSNTNGVFIKGEYNTLLHNTVRANDTVNFNIESTDMANNDISIDNTIDGRPIYYEKNISGKIYSDSINAGAFYCIGCHDITLKNVSLSEKRAQMVFWHTDNSLVEGLRSADESVDIALYYSSNNTIKKNIFNSIKVHKSSNYNKIHNNNIMTDDSGYTVVSSSTGNSFNETLPVGGNYWRSNERCKDLNGDDICDSAYFFNGGGDSFPWAQKTDFNAPAGPSNVLFLPGLEASRLYMNDGSGEDQLWEPNYFGNDIENLMMNENGESNNSVYTKEVIDEVGDIWAGGNIYKSFENKLKELKENGTINEYGMFAYDWRKNVEDVATEDTAYFPGIMKNALSTTKLLADSSKSKKVTIVAHSNGGLVAKAIMQELEKEDKADMVDKIILVASPQMGTPLSILSMLYGYDQSLLWGTLMNKSEARKFAENMPGAYGLLPSKTYLERIEDPMIKFFSENTRYKTFKDAYGNDITRDEYDQFIDFLLGKGDGRVKPDANRTQLENVLNENLLGQAKELHERLDSWVPPSNVQVIQIAGWGLDTISGIEYKEEKGTICVSYSSKVPSCMETDTFYEPYYDPIKTVDGDEVVVAPSALMFPEVDNVKRYWVDLWSYNDLLTMKRKHKDILEVDSVNEFISNIITKNTEVALPEHISTSRPNDYEGAKPRLRMSLYSPLNIHLYSENKHTGLKTIEESGQQYTIIEEQIPNSYYYQFDDRKYLGIPVGENIQVEMNGYDNGSYTLKMEEVKVTASGEETTTQTTFANLPVSPNTKVTLDIPETGLANLPNLKADYDGDGSIDYEATINPNGETQIIDNVKPTIEITSPEAREYLNNQIIDFIYDVKDNLSEKEDILIQTKLDNQEITESKIDLSMLNLGNHTIKITAIDKANNTQEKEITFSITTNIKAIQENIKKYYEKRLIKSKQQKNMLLVSLDVIEQKLNFLEMIENNPHISQKAKETIKKIVKKQIEQHIDFLIKQINQKQKYYDAKVKILLIEDLQWLELNAVK